LTLWRDEFRYEHPEKGMIWLEGQSSPNLEPGGDIVWHGYVQDVTERMRAELELRASEARSRALFDSKLLGVICWNVNGAITDANDKFLEMLGYCREDLRAGQLDWVDMTPPEYRCLVEEALAELKATGANRHPFEKEYVRKDGTRLPVLVAGVMLDEARLNGVAFVLDISQRKDAEARMQKLHADRMNLMKSMAAGLAHEINQPLAATVVYLKTLRRLLDMQPERRPASVVEALDKAAAQATRMGQIVTRLRAFIAHGEPDKILLKLHQLIRDAYDAISIKAKERKIRVTLQLNAEEDEVLADKVQIEQVLVNLIRNAKEAIGVSKRREIVISTSSSGIEVRVDIADTGIGLSQKVKSSLFEPFMTTKANGMGVGLSISRAIIQAHHGRIWAESNPEGGAIFSFTLPLASHRPVLEDE
jgi:PAS domain S-box-containing protein